MSNKLRVTRRHFLNQLCGFSLTPLMSLNFSYHINQLLLAKTDKIALIYATRYGATQDTATWIKAGLRNDVAIMNIESINFKAVISNYDYFIIGSGIWTGGVHKKLVEFLSTGSNQLANRVIASFIVCGSSDDTEKGKVRIANYFTSMHNPLGYEPQYFNHLGGRIIVEQLSAEDKAALTRFYRKYLNQELVSWDRTDKNKAHSYAEKVAKLLSIEGSKRLIVD